MSDIFVIKLGGSMISTKDTLFDFNYLKKIKPILKSRIEQGDKFCLILGGGYTMRKYRDLARDQGGIEDKNEQHWIGTTVNVLHAEIVRAFFSDMAEERPFAYEDYYSDDSFEFKKSILVGGGGRAGHSGDVDAILLAEKVGAMKIISLKNVGHLYSADPKKDSTAKEVKKCTWDEYFDIIGGKTVHEPGGNYVVDPVASRMADEKGMSFYICHGQNFESFEKILNGEEFEGSVISN